MSRRRYRNRYEGPQSVQHAAAPAQPILSKPVQIDPAKLEILDMKVFAMLPTLAQDEAAAQAALPQLIDLMERVVIGGLAGRPIAEFWPTVAEVGRQLGALGNPKN